MMEKGIIIETHGKTATVRMDKAQSCSHCKAGCIERNGAMIAEAENPIEAKVGDIVSLEINSKTALTATLVVFGLPLVALFSGVLVADLVTENQIYSVVTGIAMFILTLIPVKAYDNHLKKTGVCSVTITDILS